MSIESHWLLPDGVADVLPPEARRLERLRRRLLDLFHTWGYEYVIPPMVEFLESLLTGTGKDLDMKTLKVVDLLSGRMMGVRADITPQVARIDAHSLKREGVARLCYAGTVVEAAPEAMLASRTPLSLGAELFGESSAKGDLEIVSLMVDALRSLGLNGLHVSLGDVSLFRQYMAFLEVSREQAEALFALAQRKDGAALAAQATAFGIGEQEAARLRRLPALCGGAETLDEARRLFKDLPPLLAAVDNLALVSEALAARFADLQLYFDLSELRGYAYHTGIVFSAYLAGEGKALAKGGRYDDIGGVFGRPGRGATGFSMDVRNLLAEAALPEAAASGRRVRLGAVEDAMRPGLWAEIKRLRDAGHVVVEDAEAPDCSCSLEGQGGAWTLAEIGGGR